MNIINVIHGDSLKAMQSMKDNQYDVAFPDPNYGLNADKPSKKPAKVRQKNGAKLHVKQAEYIKSDWDNKPADFSTIQKIIRVSANQIIWGCNYYDYPLPGGRIIWDKMNGGSDQYDCEIAYNSFSKRIDIVRYMWAGMHQGEIISENYNEANKQQGNKTLNEKRIHECQKPVKLYKWILNKYISKGSTIIDQFGGSCNLALACIDLGYSLDIYEINEDKYLIAADNIKKYVDQLDLSRPAVKVNFIEQ